MATNDRREAEQGRPRPARILIAVATRERPAGLTSLLESLDRCQIPAHSDVECLVVDNDESGSAADTVDRISIQMPIRYLHEPRTGIPFARNAALDASAGFDFLVFVDDDETVDEQWLVELHRAIGAYGADVATGPVMRAPVEATPEWILACGYFGQPAVRDGEPLRTARTSNVLVRLSAVRDRQLRFDETYPLLGGEDSWFFEQLQRSGGRIIWAAHATVHEAIPSTRTRLRWLLRRSFRVGLASTRRRRFHQPGVRSLVIELARFAWRAADALRLLLVAPLAGRAGLAKAALRAAESAGTLTGLLGATFDEYRVVDGG